MKIYKYSYSTETGKIKRLELDAIETGKTIRFSEPGCFAGTPDIHTWVSKDALGKYRERKEAVYLLNDDYELAKKLLYEHYADKAINIVKQIESLTKETHDIIATMGNIERNEQ